ncbi:MAG: nitrile hydratase accessory protein [Candidatus Competibacterales bacterium]
MEDLRHPLPEDQPTFAEPWQAQAFALVVSLHQGGHFPWSEWAETLGAVIREASPDGGDDDGRGYYHHWLVALERLVVAKGLTSADTLAAYRDAWATAHRTTPHGQPVKLPPRGG